MASDSNTPLQQSTFDRFLDRITPIIEVKKWRRISAAVFLGSAALLWLWVMGRSSVPISDLGPEYLVVSIEAFLGIMFIEYLLIEIWKLQCKRAAKVDEQTACPRNAEYNFSNVIVALLSGGIQQSLVGLILKPAGMPMVWYAWVYNHINTGVNLPFFLAILGMDLCFYWMHRSAHVHSLLWASHSVHHASPSFNLTTGIRIAWVQTCFQWLFYLPGALLISPSTMWLCLQFHDAFTYLTHCYAVDRLPKFLENFFVTPAHHRVHHDVRVHKNFGGIFIIWDFLFGTFLDEDEYRTTLDQKELQGRDPYLGRHLFGVPEHRWSGPVWQILQIGPYVNAFAKIFDAAKTLSISRVLRSLRGPGYETLNLKRNMPLPREEPPNRAYTLSRTKKICIVIGAIGTILILDQIPRDIAEYSVGFRFAFFGGMLLIGGISAAFFPSNARI